jgi:hypothetical protein
MVALKRGCGRDLSFDEVYYISEIAVEAYHDFRGSHWKKPDVYCGNESRLCKECAVLGGFIW